MGTVDRNSLLGTGPISRGPQGTEATQGPSSVSKTAPQIEGAKDAPRSSVVMAPIELTPPSEESAVSELDQAQAPWNETVGVQGDGASLKQIEQSLEKAKQAGVNAAKRTFWGKLAGAVMTGIGLTLFAVAAVTTLGAAPLVVAGLVMTSAYLLKSSADAVSAYRNLRNEQAVARGEDKPYKQPCGPDALANLLHPLILKATSRKIDKNNAEAMEKASHKARLWSLGISAFTELGLIFAAAGTAGAATGKLGITMGLLGVRVFGGVAAMVMGMQKPESYQKASIELAQSSLEEAKREIDGIELPPLGPMDAEQLRAYQFLYNEKTKLQERYMEVWDEFQRKLDTYQAALEGASPEFSHGAQAAFDTGLLYGTDLVDKGMMVANSPVFIPFAAVGSVVRAGVVAGRNLQSLQNQQNIENDMTQAFLNLDEELQRMRHQASFLAEKKALNFPSPAP